MAGYIQPTDFTGTLDIIERNTLTFKLKTNGRFGEIREATDVNGQGKIVKLILADEVKTRLLPNMPNLKYYFINDIKRQATLSHPNLGSPVAVLCKPFAAIFDHMIFRVSRIVENDYTDSLKPCITLHDFLDQIQNYDLLNHIRGNVLHKLQRQISFDIAKALQYLHSNNITHGCCSTYSVLISNQNMPDSCIMCKVIDNGEAYRQVNTLINGDSAYDTDVFTADIRSFGHLLDELIYPVHQDGYPPTGMSSLSTSTSRNAKHAELPYTNINSESQMADETVEMQSLMGASASSAYARDEHSQEEEECWIDGGFSDEEDNEHMDLYSAPTDLVDLMYRCKDTEQRDTSMTDVATILAGVQDMHGDEHGRFEMKDRCIEIEGDAQAMRNFKLPLKDVSINREVLSRLCIVDDQNAGWDSIVDEMPRTILLLGETGSGKSTLVNVLVNYAYGVEWEDNFRFTITDMQYENDDIGNSQACSQTQWITTYTVRPIQNGRIGHELRIVDMPGYGHTSGLEKDLEITSNLHELLLKPEDEGGIDQVDLVCIVVQASSGRLTHTQKYIFNNLEEIFDKSISSNICALITFADDNVPPVLAALKEHKAPFQMHCKFNNSALYAINCSTTVSHGNWEMGMQSCRDVFCMLSIVETKSLMMSRKVLDTRKNLRERAKQLKAKVNEGLRQLQCIIYEQSKIEILLREEDENADFYPTDRLYRVREIEGMQVTNCKKCKRTCHYPCRVTRERFKRLCSVISWSGKCKKCKCSVAEHIKDGILHPDNMFIMHEPENKEMNKEKERKYEKAKEKIDNLMNTLQRNIENFKKVEAEVTGQIQQIIQLNVELDKLALSRRPSQSILYYIEMMMESEKRSMEDGYTERLQFLEDFRDEVKLSDDVVNGTFHPWAKYIDENVETSTHFQQQLSHRRKPVIPSSCALKLRPDPNGSFGVARLFYSLSS